MRPEVLNIAPIEIEAASSHGNGDSEKVEAYLAAILQEGKDPADVVREIWIDAFRGKLPSFKTFVIINKLVDGLPEEMQRDLVSIVGRGGITQLTLAREEAKTQVEKERKAAMAENLQIQKRPEGWKKPSRGLAKYYRRKKALQRREGLIPKR